MADNNNPAGLDFKYTTYENERGEALYTKDIKQTTVYKGKTVLAGKVITIAGQPVWHVFTRQELEANLKAAEKKQADSDKAVKSKLDQVKRVQQQETTGQPASGAAAPAGPGGYTGATGAGSSSDSAWADFSLDQKILVDHKDPTQDTPGGMFMQAPVNDNGLVGAGTRKSANDLLKDLYNKTPAEIKALQQKLKDSGASVDVNGVVDPDTLNAYKLLLNTVETYQNNGKNLTPDEVLDSLAAAGKKSAKTTTDTATSVSLTDPVTARATLEDAMTQKLGRKPTPQEVAQFTGALNAYESQNAQTTTRTTTTDASGNSTSSQSTTGSSGDPSAFASNYLLDAHGPEVKAINHLNWYNVALGALAQSPVSTGLPT